MPPCKKLSQLGDIIKIHKEEVISRHCGPEHIIDYTNELTSLIEEFHSILETILQEDDIKAVDLKYKLDSLFLGTDIPISIQADLTARLLLEFNNEKSILDKPTDLENAVKQKEDKNGKPEQKDESDEYLKIVEAESYMRNKLNRKAYDFYKKASEKNPKSVTAWLGIASAIIAWVDYGEDGREFCDTDTLVKMDESEKKSLFEEAEEALKKAFELTNVKSSIYYAFSVLNSRKNKRNNPHKLLYKALLACEDEKKKGLITETDYQKMVDCIKADYRLCFNGLELTVDNPPGRIRRFLHSFD